MHEKYMCVYKTTSPTVILCLVGCVGTCSWYSTMPDSPIWEKGFCPSPNAADDRDVNCSLYDPIRKNSDPGCSPPSIGIDSFDERETRRKLVRLHSFSKVKSCLADLAMWPKHRRSLKGPRE